MFAGEFAIKLDEKNRLVLPAKFRIFLTRPEDREGIFVVVNPSGQERCLRLYTRREYRKIAEHLMRTADRAAVPAEFLRIFASRSEFAPLDKQFRFVVPQKLAEFAGLSRDVLMIGATEWIEVWNPKEWSAQGERAQAKYADLMPRALWRSRGD